MPTSADFVALLLSQEGDQYIFGVEVSADDDNPEAFDCSELVQWGANRLGVVPPCPDGSWLQARHCQKAGLLVPLAEAFTTAGALLFRFSSDPFIGGRPKAAHVAVSQGNGKTIEARGKASGVGQFNVAARGWTHAGLVPGLDYTAAPSPDPGGEMTPEAAAFFDDVYKDLMSLKNPRTGAPDPAKVTTLGNLAEEYRERVYLTGADGSKPTEVAAATLKTKGLTTADVAAIINDSQVVAPAV